jgi:hypothetical protein
MTQLSPRAQRIVSAGRLLFGDRWTSAMSRAMTCSPTFLTMIASGERAVTDATEALFLRTLVAERLRLRATSAALKAILDEAKADA